MTIIFFYCFDKSLASSYNQQYIISIFTLILTGVTVLLYPPEVDAVNDIL
jgi:hypothetical protein